MKILLTGGSGQLGHTLQGSLCTFGEICAPTRSRLDLRDDAAIRRIIREENPDLIVNAAAYTAVDLAETNEEEAFLINATAPAVLATEAQRTGAGLIHFSSDYVFDGKKKTPYLEADLPAPLSVYGKTKAAGEQLIQERHNAYWIIRTSWLYSSFGNNFVSTILRLASDKNELVVVDDQIGSPTSASTIAGALTAMLTPADDHPEGLRSRMHTSAGIYHLTAEGATSWNGYARHIVAQARRLGMQLRCEVNAIRPVSSAQYGAPAARPLNSRLNTEKIKKTFQLQLPPWEFAVNQCIAKKAAR